MHEKPVRAQDPEVLIVGAGPVGLTLALDLGRRGVRCRVVEREHAPMTLPKMERCNARTMEIFRRLGVADRIRARAMPTHVPMDIFIVSRLADPPILRLPYPSVDDARARSANVNDGSQPLEPYQLVSQYTLEPVLLDAVRELPTVEVNFDCALTAFAQDDDGVTADLEHVDGRRERLRVPYLVGCDGGGSTVRKALGIPLQGDGALAELNQVFFRSPDLVARVPRAGLGRHFYVADADPRMIGTAIVIQDDQEHFVFHTTLTDQAEIEEAIRDAVGEPITLEILAANRWRLHLLLAERYGSGRVFLAGDAVRLVIPQGGLGMNTGIGDAIDLSWKLAATLAGWGGPELLASYEQERRQVGERVVRASRRAAQAVATWRQASNQWIREDSERGRRTRAAVARMADVEQRKSHEMLGIELGYRYLTSPVVAYDSDETDEFRFDYQPSSAPGYRLPHVWLGEGAALHDRIGAGYTLLRLSPDAPDTSGLEAALQATGAPLNVLQLDDPAPARVYGYPLLLLRPDLHVAWRGTHPPTEPEAVARLVTGWTTAVPAREDATAVRVGTP